MHVIRRKRLLTVIAILSVLSIVVALVLYALRQNINVFYSPSEIRLGHAPENRMVRLGGMVLPGSVERRQNLIVKFQVTDFKAQVPVVYHGVLPDLFNEGKGVVVEGRWLQGSTFKAVRVLAKHDENYMPPAVKEMLQDKIS